MFTPYAFWKDVTKVPVGVLSTYLTERRKAFLNLANLPIFKLLLFAFLSHDKNLLKSSGSSMEFTLCSFLYSAALRVSHFEKSLLFVSFRSFPNFLQ